MKPFLPKLLHHIQAAHYGHIKISDHNIRMSIADHFQSVLTVRSLPNPFSSQLIPGNRPFHPLQDLALIINDRNFPHYPYLLKLRSIESRQFLLYSMETLTILPFRILSTDYNLNSEDQSFLVGGSVSSGSIISTLVPPSSRSLSVIP
ncbi:hypothetical protein D3C71_1644280 [compost metagenome]